MSDSQFDTGLKMRKAVLGEEYVERAMAGLDDFSREFQEKIVTDYTWGFIWGDDTLERKTRSILNLGMLAALGRAEEFELHVRGALNNGVSRDELKAVLHQIAMYCGVPAGVSAFRSARKVLAELDAG
jgi:4-carboxymuconolactone decarboxylase